MNAPEILFADEPTGALNRSAAREVMRELIRVNREGTAVLLVTHDSGARASATGYCICWTAAFAAN